MQVSLYVCMLICSLMPQIHESLTITEQIRNLYKSSEKRQLSPKDVADSLGISYETAYGTVSRLCREGYLQKIRRGQYQYAFDDEDMEGATRKQPSHHIGEEKIEIINKRIAYDIQQLEKSSKKPILLDACNDLIWIARHHEQTENNDIVNVINCFFEYEKEVQHKILDLLYVLTTEDTSVRRIDEINPNLYYIYACDVVLQAIITTLDSQDYNRKRAWELYSITGKISSVVAVIIELVMKGSDWNEFRFGGAIRHISNGSEKERKHFVQSIYRCLESEDEEIAWRANSIRENMREYAYFEFMGLEG